MGKRSEQSPANRPRGSSIRSGGDKSAATRATSPTRSEIERVRSFDWFWLVLLLLPPVLLFPRIGDGCLWQDEAETGMIGRAILAHGYPLAFVGPNIITDQPRRADLSSSGIWIWAPWLPGYLAAAGMALMGVTTTAARLPFVLAGWISLFVHYAALKDITRHRRPSLYATFC